MKKVGIITYHFARNYGAVLQCYALQSHLVRKGYNVEVFDFVNEKQKKNNDVIKHGKQIKSLIANFCLIPFFSKIRKKHNAYEMFCKDYLHLTKHIADINELQQYINSNQFDAIISGSDQVLNPNIEDFDIAFLYPFTTETKKITYAASTGNASADDITKLSKYLDDFKRISIREKKDLEKFEIISKDEIQIVCDPVMLLDAHDWKDMIDFSEKKPYLVCYFLHKNLFDAEFDMAQNIARKLGLEFKVINARFTKKSFIKGTVFDAGPKEFIDLIANADYVCTDSFHGTLFSMIFQKRFTCFDTRKNINDTRRKGLLESVGALSAYQNVEDELSICDNLDYKTVFMKMNDMRQSASKYLEILDEE